MSLAEYVRILGRGPGRSRSLTQTEAGEAMRIMLSGLAPPEAVGALLMLLRMKGETAAEIAGLASATGDLKSELPQVDLDWPSYAAGRTRGQPWFLLSAKLVAQAGHRVLLHGWNGFDTKVREGLAELGIGVAEHAKDAARLLDRDGLAYLPLENFNPALFDLLRLRDVLGLRSCINTVCRMQNPAKASASVQGVFHPSYRELQVDAAALMGCAAMSVIKGAGGEFECNPAKDIAVYGLRGGQRWEGTNRARRDEHRRLCAGAELSISSVWDGRVRADFETDVVIATTAVALDTLGRQDAEMLAVDLWHGRAERSAA